MAQVTFPGVYVREVPSGARTITGVSTSIAAFVGMTRRGPLREPTTVLGFAEFVRIFSADTSQGELPDQVRQFFLNGGTQAIIMRIGATSTTSPSVPTSAATVTLKNGPATTDPNVLTLTSRGAGDDENSLRVRVDYATSDPGRTFNLTISREVVDASGNVSTGEEELLRNLSPDPLSPRFVEQVVEHESALLAEAEFLPPPPAPIPGNSTSGPSSDPDAVLVRLKKAVDKTGTGSFRFIIGTQSGIATLAAAASFTAGDVDTAIKNALGLAANITTSDASSGDLVITANTAVDVRITPAPENDIAVAMHLGVAQGGEELGSLSAQRPVATPPGGPLARFTGGKNGTAPTVSDYQDAYDIIDSKVDLFNLLVLPRSTADIRDTLWGPASVFCDKRRAFLLMDGTSDTVDEAEDEVVALRPGLVKDHAALYWPPIVVNPDGLRRAIDVTGTVAGIMSRIDSNRGVWKAPAGLEADLRGALAVSVPMSDPENGLLNPRALNAIRVFPNGIVVWGARTMDGFDNSGNDDFKYVPVRRFELFIEESLARGLKFAVFEPNDEPLWAQIRLAVGAFMNNLFRQGAFAGKTTRDAYFVKVDSETTTQNDINLGIVNVVVGFAPLKPAEFVVITIKQQAGQIQV
jgi:phage tail sheath protein FI